VKGPLVVLGDALLDIDMVGRADRLCPDAAAPVLEDVTEQARPGGAALAALLAAMDGHEVVLVTPLAEDEAGHRLRGMLEGRVRVVALPGGGSTSVKRRILASGQSVARLDSGGSGSGCGPLPSEVEVLLSRAAAVLVSDYGRGVTGHAHVQELLTRAGQSCPLVWDPHPRGAAPVSTARLVTPNQSEAALFAGQLESAGQQRPYAHNGQGEGSIQPSAAPSSPVAAAAGQADLLLEAWGVSAVVITMGSNGALLSYGCGAPALIPATTLGRVDTCGAGDSFAAAAAGALANGALTAEAIQYAVAAASSFLASGGATTIARSLQDDPAQPQPPGDPAQSRSPGDPAAPPERGAAVTTTPPVGSAAVAETLGRSIRARGGIVVATGGCFDLLHAGHIATLRDAREMGDCLIVCLNSDDSVRRQKGPQRPLVPEQDRAEVLLALACVDAVVIFGEDTPERVLGRLRPDLWVKGGDYVGTNLPEAAVLARWGGQAVVLPYLAGRSTTQLVHSAAASGGGAAARNGAAASDSPARPLAEGVNR